VCYYSISNVLFLPLTDYQQTAPVEATDKEMRSIRKD
jgi:hypothetical protein